MNDQLLEYIRAHPGCTVSGANRALRCDQSIGDWIKTALEFDQLEAGGKIERREFRGVAVFYAKDE